VHAALAEAYRQQGRPADAKNEFQTAIDLDGDNWRWPYLLGALQIDSGDLKGAEENLKAALGKTPDNARVLYNLGLLHQKQDRLGDAEAMLEKSVALDARADTILALGNVLMQRGALDRAVQMYKRAVEVSPSEYDAWGDLGIAYVVSGSNPQEAADSFKRAIALALDEVKKTPEDSYLASVLGRYYANLKDSNRALPWLRKAVALAPDDPSVIERVGESYEALGNRSDALTYIARALRLGYSVSYAKADPTLRELRRDPNAPPEIRESNNSQ
jgi:Flp pilus assembly protein TadD